MAAFALHRYTPQQLYDVVANVDQYQHFVPWCSKSRAFKGESGDFQAELEIGFPPVVERYTSEVTVIPNHKIRVSVWGKRHDFLVIAFRPLPETNYITFKTGRVHRWIRVPSS